MLWLIQFLTVVPVSAAVLTMAITGKLNRLCVLLVALALHVCGRNGLARKVAGIQSEKTDLP